MDAAASPVEQRHTDPVLQAAQVTADGRFLHPERRGRLAEAAVLRRGHEVLDVTEFHVGATVPRYAFHRAYLAARGFTHRDAVDTRCDQRVGDSTCSVVRCVASRRRFGRRPCGRPPDRLGYFFSGAGAAASAPAACCSVRTSTMCALTLAATWSIEKLAGNWLGGQSMKVSRNAEPFIVAMPVR